MGKCYGKINMSYDIIFDKNTSAYFNELSIYNVDDRNLDVVNFFEIVKFIKTILNVCLIRIDKESYSKIIGILYKELKYKNHFELFLSYFKPPFEKDLDNCDFADFQYINYNWFYKNQQIMGLAYAYLNNSFSVSFNSASFDVQLIEIKIIKNNVEELCKIYNIASDKQKQFFEQLYANNKEIELIESHISNDEKYLSYILVLYH